MIKIIVVQLVCSLLVIRNIIIFYRCFDISFGGWHWCLGRRDKKSTLVVISRHILDLLLWRYVWYVCSTWNESERNQIYNTVQKSLMKYYSTTYRLRSKMCVNILNLSVIKDWWMNFVDERHDVYWGKNRAAKYQP